MHRQVLQKLIVLMLRPYISRELRGWGKLQAIALDYRRDWLWRDAPVVTMRGKEHGYVTALDLSHWQDRSTFFLGRWHDARLMSFATAYIKPGDTIIDVGANRGSFSLYASKIAGKVISFEPNPKVIEKLKSDIARNGIKNIVIEQCGLGDRDDELPLHIPTYNSGEASFGVIQNAELRLAQIRRGDEILRNEKPAFIKMDVEGFETKVIAGLRESIARHKPIIVTEVIRHQLERCGSSPEELSRSLVSLGYRGHRLGLTRTQSGLSFSLDPLDLSSKGFDAAWLPN